MKTTLYVGNLPWSTTDNDLYDLFESAGGVENVRVVTDRDTGRSKGFGFVEMMSEDDATNAIQKLDGTDFCGRQLRVNRAVQNAARGGSGGAFRSDNSSPRMRSYHSDGGVNGNVGGRRGGAF